MALAVIKKSKIFLLNPIENLSRKMFKKGTAFQTLFLDISNDFIKKWEPKLEPDFPKNLSRKEMDFRTRFRKA